MRNLHCRNWVRKLNFLWGKPANTFRLTHVQFYATQYARCVHAPSFRYVRSRWLSVCKLWNGSVDVPNFGEILGSGCNFSCGEKNIPIAVCRNMGILFSLKFFSHITRTMVHRCTKCHLVAAGNGFLGIIFINFPAQKGPLLWKLWGPISRQRSNSDIYPKTFHTQAIEESQKVNLAEFRFFLVEQPLVYR